MSGSTAIEGPQDLDGIAWGMARLNHARGAPAKPGHPAAQGLFLTQAAFHADVMLPASVFAEEFGTSLGRNYHLVILGQYFSLSQVGFSDTIRLLQD